MPRAGGGHMPEAGAHHDDRRPAPMLDDLRRFSTDAYPEELRAPAWAEVLARARLAPQGPVAGALAPQGCVSARNSALDSVFLRLQSSPQCWTPLAPGPGRSAACVLVVALLEGSGLVHLGHESRALAAGSAVVLDPGQPWRLDLNTDFRAAVVRLESASFVQRLLRTHDEALPVASPRSGVGAVCVNLLRSIADQLDQLGRHELLPLEATLTELLLACLSHVDDDAAQRAADDDTTSVQLGHLRRACRTIEARLADAQLDLSQVARLEGLSPRYLQKLFKGAGTSFSEYLRQRRLERCRLDLANRALDHFGIAELCFRWGFNDAAHFSRSFTARYGLTPSAFRAMPPPPARAAQRGDPGPLAIPPSAAPASKAAAAPPQAQPPDDGERCRQLAAVLDEHERYALALALAPKRALAHEHLRGTAGPGSADFHYVPVSERTVHWGYLSRALKPVISVRSGDVVTLETLTQHAGDDRERMVDGDPGAESVFRWTRGDKAVARRGAGPMDASIYGRGAGEGFGVHICTGPVHVRDAEPGDVLEVRILDIRTRPSCHPRHRGRIFGSNAAAWWGYQYRDLITEPREREVVTIYELHPEADEPHATALYNFRWTPQTDPDGIRHETIDYPGVPVDPATIERRHGVLARARVPIRPHFGVLAVAPREGGLIDLIPPGYFGGNLDNWRAGKGARLFLPVNVEGALFSAGDPHASQGDGEVCGTAIECSLTGSFQLVLHKRGRIEDPFIAGLDHPFLDCDDAWVVQGFSFANHLAELGPQAQAEVYRRSSLDLAMRDAFRKARRYLMQAHGLDEDEALSLLSVAVDFGVTQVADGNWGVHAVIRKSIFPDAAAG